jgi:hypothetical protein
MTEHQPRDQAVACKRCGPKMKNGHPQPTMTMNWNRDCGFHDEVTTVTKGKS